MFFCCCCLLCVLLKRDLEWFVSEMGTLKLNFRAPKTDQDENVTASCVVLTCAHFNGKGNTDNFAQGTQALFFNLPFPVSPAIP